MDLGFLSGGEHNFDNRSLSRRGLVKEAAAAYVSRFFIFSLPRVSRSTNMLTIFLNIHQYVYSVLSLTKTIIRSDYCDLSIRRYF